MLHLYLFIWPCLLVAFILGLVAGYFRRPQGNDTAKALADDLNDLKKTLVERDKQLTSLREDQGKQLDTLKNELTSAKTERDRLRAEAIPLNLKVDELSRNLNDLQRQHNPGGSGPQTLGHLATIAQERDLLITERDQLKLALAQAQDQLTAHTQALTQANANIHTANQTIHTAQTQLQAQAEELDRLRTAAPPPTTDKQDKQDETDGLVIPEAELGHQDDLKEIVGVGPFIAAKLHHLGLHTYKQIAELSPEMLEKVAASIEYFQGRIGRENWTEQCKALHFDKYGEKL